jgi:hypothetical protein
MIRRGWRFLALSVLYLLPSIEAQAQRGAVRERWRRAFAEVSRAEDPLVAKRAREAVLAALGGVREDRGVDAVAAAIRGHLESKKLNVKLEQRGHQQLFTLEPAPSSGLRPTGRLGAKEAQERRRVDAVLQRMLNGAMRRDRILEEIGATEVSSLEGRRLDGRTQSELEAYLEKSGVPDYKEMASSFDANTKVKVSTLTRQVSLLRIFGGTSKATGRYLFCCLESATNAPPWVRALGGRFAGWTDASGLALPIGNLSLDLAVITLPIGTRILTGTVADNFPDAKGQSRLGGNTQIVLYEGKVDFPHRRLRLKGQEAEASDIMVMFENQKVLRFQPGPGQD